MPYSNYTELKAAVIAQTKRGDRDLLFDNFLAITDVEIRANPKGALILNDNEIITDLTASTSSRFLSIPTSFQSSRELTITLDNGIHNLTFRTPEQMKIRPDTGTPYFYTVAANQIEFDILPDETYTVTLTYTANVLPLTAAAPTNYILTKYPNVYLFGCLKQSAIFSEKWEAAGMYDGLFSEAIASANSAEHDIKYSGQVEETVHWAP